MADSTKTNKLGGAYALITGAAGLLGPQHARALLEIGASLILTDIDENKIKHVENELQTEYPGSRIISSKLDVADQTSVDGIFQYLEKEDIIPSILINNAAIDAKRSGMNESTGRLEDISYEQWKLEFDVGLYGALLMSRAFSIRLLEKNLKGTIINVASDLSVFAPNQEIYKDPTEKDNDKSAVKPVTYCVIKHALVGLTKYLATYWPPETIRVNSISPGGVYTNQDEEFVKRLSKLIPMGRMAKQSEYRGAIQFLASDMSSYMHGQNLVMDGGRSVW